MIGRSVSYVFRHSKVTASKSLARQSLAPVTNMVFSLLNWMFIIVFVCASTSRTHSPVFGLYARSIPSSHPAIRCSFIAVHRICWIFWWGGSLVSEMTRVGSVGWFSGLKS